MALHKTYTTKDFSRSLEWVRCLQGMLQDAGLYDPAAPWRTEASPISTPYVEAEFDTRTRKQIGETMLCFMVSPRWPQEDVEAVFHPHKAVSFSFRVPLQEAETWVKDS